MRRIVELVRLEEHTDGTFGVLKINKSVFCVTLEPPDRCNQPNRSCIPAQQYSCRRIQSARYGSTFQVTNVPGRSQILFHAGNIAENTEGCILLGQFFGKLKADRAVLNSGATFKAFLALMVNEHEFHLTVSEAY